jgi:hypothetical protein
MGFEPTFPQVSMAVNTLPYLFQRTFSASVNSTHCNA